MDEKEIRLEGDQIQSLSNQIVATIGPRIVEMIQEQIVTQDWFIDLVTERVVSDLRRRGLDVP